MSKNTIFIAILILLVIFFGFYLIRTDDVGISDIIVVDFETCASAGNPVMESYPRKCIHEGVTYIEDISDRVFTCSEDQKNADVCIEIYQPVCGVVNVQCITEPCDPVEETFSNSCFACSNSLVESYTEGECLVE